MTPGPRDAPLAPMAAPALPDEARRFFGCSGREEEALRTRMEQSFRLPAAAAERAALRDQFRRRGA